MATIAVPAPRSRARVGWVRPAFAGVLVLAAVLCLWNLTISGYSNEYYAAAARSAAESWKAWFFGSIDPGSFITVDKPPLSLMLMGLSARVFGFSSFSILLPQALCTIAAVAVLFATVRRVAGDVAGLVAALALALTPITVAIGRVNNPDALLVLLLVLSAYFTVRALESGRGRHLAFAGAIVGLAFMTKMLQGWMVVPALGLAYLVAGPPALWVRVRQLVVAFGVMVAVSCAWPLAVTLWPGSKPYIGGSTDGSVWNLILGYNGFGRIFGEGSGPGGGGGPTFGGSAGLLRMFNAQVGGQIAWLLPLALASLGCGLWFTRRAPRTDLRRAGFILFGTWALVHVAVFSTQQGIFHPYYVSALAPAIAALVGMWRAPRPVTAAAIAGTAWLSVSLLDRTPDFLPWLRVAIIIAATLAVAALLLPRRRATLVGAAIAGAAAVAAGPAAYAVANVGHALNGNNVLAGPSSVSRGGFGGGPGGGGGMRGGFAGGPPAGNFNPGGAPPSGSAAGGTAQGGVPSSGSAAGGAAQGGVPSSGSAAGGAAQGGVPSSGSAAGGAAQGGVPSSGSAGGGAAQGGAPPSGSAAGGTTQGGAPLSGSAAGGTAQGGVPSSGSAAGGTTQGGVPSSGSAAGGAAQGGVPSSGSAAGGTAQGGAPPSSSAAGGSSSGSAQGGGPPSGSGTGGSSSGSAPAGGFSPPGGGPGGFGGGGEVSDSMLSYLEAHQGSAKYLLAASGSQTTAPIIIKTGKAVVTIGGFSGQDNAPTVSQLQQLVSSGELKYVLLGGRGGDTLASWVQQHGKAVSGYSNLYAVSV